MKYINGSSTGVPFYAGPIVLTGTANPENVDFGFTFYKDNPYVKLIGTRVSVVLTGTAEVDDVANGKTFYNTGPKLMGTHKCALGGGTRTVVKKEIVKEKSVLEEPLLLLVADLLLQKRRKRHVGGA
jgi:hypothetical protein